MKFAVYIYDNKSPFTATEEFDGVEDFVDTIAHERWLSVEPRLANRPNPEVMFVSTSLIKKFYSI